MGSCLRRMTCLGLGFLVAGLAATPIAAHDDDPKSTFVVAPSNMGPIYRKPRELHGPTVPGEYELEIMSQIPNPAFGTGAEQASDCWGYVSATGREYALHCLRNGIAFVEVTDPANPVIIETFTGPDCTWRDVKVFETYAYLVSECGNGIRIYDMSQIDKGLVVHVRDVTDGGDASHNVAINTDSGFLYRTGGSGNGLIVYDLNADPTEPPLVGNWPDRYVHDAQVVMINEGPLAGREVAFCNGGFSGGWVEPGVTILDVTDKRDIVTLAHVPYPDSAYSHQGWLSADQQTYYINDEGDEWFGLVGETTTHMLNVADLEHPTWVGTFSTGLGSSDHNLYVRGNLIFEANYQSGLRVFDGTNPHAPVEVAFYDTFPDSDDAGFNGLWSCFPFFPSGTVIGSDRSGGLFVWKMHTPLVGDLDGDGLVDTSDLLTMLFNWGECEGDCPPEYCVGDIDQNCVVDVADLLMLLNGWTG